MTIRGRQLEKRAVKILEDQGNISKILKGYLPKGGLFEETILDSLIGSSPAHPIPYVMKGIEDQIYEVMRKISNMRELRVDLTEMIPSMIEYVPTPVEESFERDNRVLETTTAAKH